MTDGSVFCCPRRHTLDQFALWHPAESSSTSLFVSKGRLHLQFFSMDRHPVTFCEDSVLTRPTAPIWSFCFTSSLPLPSSHPAARIPATEVLDRSGANTHVATVVSSLHSDSHGTMGLQRSSSSWFKITTVTGSKVTRATSRHEPQ